MVTSVFKTRVLPSVQFIVREVSSVPSEPPTLYRSGRSRHRLVIEVCDGRERLHLHRLVGVSEVCVGSLMQGAQL